MIPLAPPVRSWPKIWSPFDEHGLGYLQEEQRHDREVVADQAARRKSDEEAGDGSDHHHQGNRDHGRQVDAELGELSIA